jgi:hypothetical protein
MGTLEDDDVSPIRNASLPGILAGLSLTALALPNEGTLLKLTLVSSTVLYIVCSLALFLLSLVWENHSKVVRRVTRPLMQYSFIAALGFTLVSALILTASFL